MLMLIMSSGELSLRYDNESIKSNYYSRRTLNSKHYRSLCVSFSLRCVGSIGCFDTSLSLVRADIVTGQQHRVHPDPGDCDARSRDGERCSQAAAQGDVPREGRAAYGPNPRRRRVSAGERGVGRLIRHEDIAFCPPIRMLTRPRRRLTRR